MIASSAFVILKERTNKINLETLYVFLRTDFFAEWSFKFYTGTSYPTLADEDILNIPIPLIPQHIQLQIEELINHSFLLRRESKKLLEKAKRLVEIAIEEGEEKALNLSKTVMSGDCCREC